MSSSNNEQFFLPIYVPPLCYHPGGVSYNTQTHQIRHVGRHLGVQCPFFTFCLCHLLCNRPSVPPFLHQFKANSNYLGGNTL